MWFISPREYWTLKQIVAWFFVLVAATGVVISYCGIYVLAAYFAAGLVWWASLSLLFSGPIGLGAFGLAWSKPRQPIAMVIGFLVFFAWGFLWLLLFLARF